MIGIYKITNTINDHSYIGQSKYIEQRWTRHKQTVYSGTNKSRNYPLYRAMRKYGIENFKFEIIEECPIDDLNTREQYWITYYDSFFHGYNQTLGGNASGQAINKPKIIGIISDLENTNISQKQIAKKWDVSFSLVRGINHGQYWRQDRHYPIRNTVMPPKEKHYCIDCGKPIGSKSLRCNDCENKHRVIPLNKMPLTREELKNQIRTVPFVHIAEKYGVTNKTICKWCSKFNLPNKVSEIKQYSDTEWALI